ncbi:MAG: flagellar M-ring protein FliF [Bdellovibrionaceae bacterium]|nr:flagellar M-ring protein FliF [Pseudobdellovibrionaceae bacterium]
MQKVIGNIIAQFNEYFKNLPPVKRMSILMAGMVAGVAGVVVVIMMSDSSYGILFKDVPPDQMPLVVEKLRQKNVQFKISDNGNTVLVPQEILHMTQMSIMSELGTTKIGTIGLELFENQDFGVTSYAQKVNYQRALQGELMRAINTISSIKNSKVVLALPPKKTFLEEEAEPTASVIIDLYPGKKLTQDQVSGIMHLVASSVENLNPDKVTVLDNDGRQLSKKYSGDSREASELLDLKSKIESKLKERIEGMLTRVVGEGKVEAQVYAKLNPQKVSTVQELVDPDTTAIRSQTTEEELLDGARTNPSGIPGARANLPGAEDQGQVGFRQNVRKELKTQNFAVPKTVKNIMESAGGVEQISVAVIVDGRVTKKLLENGTEQQEWSPRTPEELQKYEDIVKNAIGFNAKRGDSVKIENIEFSKFDFTESDKILTTLERKKLLHSLFKWTLLGFSLALFFFVVVRPFMRWITDSFQDTVEDMLPRTIEELEELQSVDSTLPGMQGALPVFNESIDPDKAESELLRERIMGILGEDSEKAAGAFSLWLSRRES